MKKQKGITLIALIITIIVMLILVVVTVMIAFGENGVITTTKKARDEHEAAAFKEYVEIVAAGNYDPTYDWNILDMNIKGKYDWIAIQNEIKLKYPETIITFNKGTLTYGAINASARNLWILEGDLYCCQAVMQFIERNNLIKNSISAAQRQMIQDALDAAKQKFIEDNPECNLTVEDFTYVLKEDCLSGLILYTNAETTFAMNGQAASMIAEYKGTVVSIGLANNNMHNYFKLMKEDEAREIFEFTDFVTEGEFTYTTIKAYKGNAKNVTIPGNIIDENGNPILVSGIEAGAFSKMYVTIAIINILTDQNTDNTNFDRLSYNNTATLADFKNVLSMYSPSFVCEHDEDGGCTRIECKNEIILSIVNAMSESDFASAGIVMGDVPISECTTTDENGVLYGCLLIKDNMVPVRASEMGESKVEQIMISEGITIIGDKAFANCVNLKEIYIPMTAHTIGNNIFYQCNSLTKIKTMNSNVANTTENWGCPNNIEREYIEWELGYK